MRDSSSDDPKTQGAAALARKRRMELRHHQRAASSEEDITNESCAERKRPRVEEDPVPSKLMPSITGIKKQSRYDPGVPMNRDELKVWRKEARRVRNRESAAASRKRNRERITELESYVENLTSKYNAALQRIMELEESTPVKDSFTPSFLSQDITSMMTRPASPEIQPMKTVSPPLSPESAPRIVNEDHATEVNKKYQHIMAMISRPVACVMIT